MFPYQLWHDLDGPLKQLTLSLWKEASIQTAQRRAEKAKMSGRSSFGK